MSAARLAPAPDYPTRAMDGATPEAIPVEPNQSHTLDCQFEHFLAYSGLFTETPEVKAKLRRAFEAASPTTAEHATCKGCKSSADEPTPALLALMSGEGPAVDDSLLQVYPATAHASDCATNNRGVPELLGPCDCAELTLQAYLDADIARGVIDHWIRSHHLPDGTVRFYIRPATTDGQTVDFALTGNTLALLKP